MWRKIKKVLIIFMLVFLFFRVFHWDTWNANPITYVEFEEKLLAEKYEKIVVNTKTNKVLLYEKESNAIDKFDLISKEKVEELVLNVKKVDEDLAYKVSNRKAGVFLFFCYMWLSLLTIKFIRFLINKIKIPKNLDEAKTSLENKLDSLKKDKGEKKKKQDEAIDELKNALKSINGETFEIKKETDIEVTFQDVIGLERELEELKDIVSFLKQPEQYRNMGAELPRGVLLYGKSGVGKTLIARAIAGEAKVSFFQISASAFQSKYVGGTEENIRKLFKEAKANAPSIIFIDEFDSVALRRYGKHSNEYSVSFLNQLLSCMDGFERMDGVMVIAATNHYEQLDDAVLRRGRFDRHIYIHEPDKKARKEMLKYYARGKNVKIDEYIESILSRTVGFTGSDIKTLMNEAAILAVRNGRENIEEIDVEEAYRKITMGSRTTREETLNNKKRTAVHEAGHALMSILLGKNVIEVSIIPRGNAAGYNMSEWEEHQELTPMEIINRVKIVLAGRAAERVVFNNVSAGASDDLQKATNYLHDMNLKFGMAKDLDVQLVLTGNMEFDKQLSIRMADRLHSYLMDYYRSTVSAIKGQKEALIKLADLLYEKEVLTEEEIKVFTAENIQLKNEP